MRRILYIPICLWISASPGWAEIVQIDPSIRMPDVWEGQTGELTIAFQNKSAQPLVLDRVEAGCHCTFPSLTTTIVAPGGLGGVYVRLASQGLAGELERTVQLFAKGQADALASLSYDVLIKPRFRATPNEIDLGQASVATAHEWTFTLKRLYGQGLMTAVTVPDPRFEVVAVRRQTNAAKIYHALKIGRGPVEWLKNVGDPIWKIRLRQRANVAPGAVFSFAVVHVSDANAAPILVPIVGVLTE